VTEPPTLAALRQSRASRTALQRRVRPLAFGALVVVVYLSAMKAPHIGWHGEHLALAIILGAFVIGVLVARHTLIVRPGPARIYVPALAVILLSSAALVRLQPDGFGVIGFIATLLLVVNARPQPGRVAFILLGLGGFVFLIPAILTAKETDHSRLLGVAVTVLPFLVVCWLVTLFARIRQQENQTEKLLLELEESRSAELRAAALAERQRLARDMHDVLAHTLSGLTLQLEGARLLALSSGDSRLAGTIDRAHELAKSGLGEARQAIGMLRGDELPGPERLAGLAEAFAADTGIPCPFTVTGETVELRAEAKLALYRITQEALTNIRKHAQPARVEVTLDYSPQEVSLTVEDCVYPGGDDPPGPPRDWGEPSPQTPWPGTPRGGYGLTGMRERAELLGGSLDAGPTGSGFLVRLRVPA
jgi:signal transduction histidine kinase